MKNDIASLKRKIRTKIPTTGDFDWVKPILAKTLDEETIDFLNTNNPDSSNYYLLKIDEHLKEANSLISFCINKRTEIYDLESNALLKALEYLEIYDNVTNDNIINELNLKAMFNLSQESDISVFDTALKDKQSKLKSLLSDRLSLHNQNGNSLNFGERVGILRLQYADAIKVLYERLYAIKKTLFHSFGQTTDLIPNYIDVSENIYTLQNWLKTVVYIFETKEQSDIVEQFSIYFTDNNSIVSNPVDPPFNTFNTISNFDFDFEIKDSDLNYDSTTESIRLIGIYVNVLTDPQIMMQQISSEYDLTKQPNAGAYYYDNPKEELQISILNSNQISARRAENWKRTNKSTYLNNMLFGCQVISPDQNIVVFSSVETYNTTAKRDNNLGSLQFYPSILLGGINLPTLSNLGDITPTEGISPKMNANLYLNKTILNINPLGKWKIKIVNNSKKNSRYFFNEQYSLEYVSDISLTLKVVKRKL